MLELISGKLLRYIGPGYAHENILSKLMWTRKWATLMIISVRKMTREEHCVVL